MKQDSKEGQCPVADYLNAILRAGQDVEMVQLLQTVPVQAVGRERALAQCVVNKSIHLHHSDLQAQNKLSLPGQGQDLHPRTMEVVSVSHWKDLIFFKYSSS